MAMIGRVILADLADRLNAPDLLRLFAAAFGSREAALRAGKRFQAGDWIPLGYEEDCEIIAFLGLESVSKSAARIRGIAVSPHHRGQGVGRELIQAVRLRNPRVTLKAETDHDAVNFYRRCGFEATSLGERYPGVERFECVLRGDAED